MPASCYSAAVLIVRLNEVGTNREKPSPFVPVQWIVEEGKGEVPEVEPVPTEALLLSRGPAPTAAPTAGKYQLSELKSCTLRAKTLLAHGGCR